MLSPIPCSSSGRATATAGTTTAGMGRGGIGAATDGTGALAGVAVWVGTAGTIAAGLSTVRDVSSKSVVVLSIGKAASCEAMSGSRAGKAVSSVGVLVEKVRLGPVAVEKVKWAPAKRALVT